MNDFDKLFDRHEVYLNDVPTDYVRELDERIDWNDRLLAIKGPKGVGKSTLMRQHILKNFGADDKHVLYCSADTNFFSTHSLVDVADWFTKIGGTHLFIDEVHKYDGWSRDIKEIYDLYKKLHVVVSGSSLIQINDGDADLSRRLLSYTMPGLSFREFLRIDCGIELPAISLEELLESPNAFCRKVKTFCKPLEHFGRYLKCGYYPFYFDNKNSFFTRVETVVNYVIDVELTKYRGIDVGNTRSLNALLQVISQMTPYEIDIAKLSRATGISRPTTLRYLKNLEEAKLIHRLFTDIRNISDLQKPDKILLDNSNLLYALCPMMPEIGTVRESFMTSMLTGAGHSVEYAGYKSGDFRIDRKYVIEVGGADKGFTQVKDQENAYVAADDIDSATLRKIPLWAFGFIY